MIQSAEQDTKQLAQVHVVGRLFESQTTTIIQVHGEFGRKTLCFNSLKKRNFDAKLFVIKPQPTLQRTSTGVDIFFSLIFSYFCFLVAALRPCQGKHPRLKYISTYPRDSMSSRLACSMPKWAFIEAYLNKGLYCSRYTLFKPRQPQTKFITNQ